MFRTKNFVHDRKLLAGSGLADQRYELLVFFVSCSFAFSEFSLPHSPLSASDLLRLKRDQESEEKGETERSENEEERKKPYCHTAASSIDE